MLLSGVLFVLFLAGCWLYCLTDAALTPAAEYRGLPKAAWIGIIAATFIVGAIAWLVARRAARAQTWPTFYAGRATLVDPADTDPSWYPHWVAADVADAPDAADAAVARHPAGRSRKTRDGRPIPIGPDDDPEFLRQLDSRIRGTSSDPGELSSSDAAVSTARVKAGTVPPAPHQHRSQLGSLDTAADGNIAHAEAHRLDVVVEHVIVVAVGILPLLFRWMTGTAVELDAQLVPVIEVVQIPDA
jgi:hypothetical protein